MSVLSFFSWCEASPLGEGIRASKWLFPVIESFHLLALAVIGGAVLLVNLRLCGLGVMGQPTAQLWKDARPWLRSSLAVMIASGLLLFTSEATKLYYNDAFWVKMVSLMLAIVFTFTLTRRVALTDPSKVSPILRKGAGIIAMILWLAVGVGGRWIGFS